VRLRAAAVLKLDVQALYAGSGGRLPADEEKGTGRVCLKEAWVAGVLGEGRGACPPPAGDQAQRPRELQGWGFCSLMSQYGMHGKGEPRTTWAHGALGMHVCLRSASRPLKALCHSPLPLLLLPLPLLPLTAAAAAAATPTGPGSGGAKGAKAAAKAGRPSSATSTVGLVCAPLYRLYVPVEALHLLLPPYCGWCRTASAGGAAGRSWQCHDLSWAHTWQTACVTHLADCSVMI